MSLPSTRRRITPGTALRVAAAVSAGRAVIGVALLVAPAAALRRWGLRRPEDEGALVLANLFAVRELVVAAMVVQAGRTGRGGRDLYLLNAFCDAGDFASAAAAVRRGNRSPGMLAALPLSAAVTVVWLALARDEA